MLLAAAWFLLPQLAQAAESPENPYSSISPESEDARDIQFLYKIIFWLALIVFIGVQIAIVITALKYRRRSDDDTRPPQTHGNMRLEILWTVIPAVVLVAIFIPTVRTMYRIDDRADEADYVVEVYGKQWWWEVHYKQPEDLGDVITANEIYIPVDTRVRFELLTSNVIHSFYVPQLAGKMDLMPGHVNVMSVQADEPGVYFGECAEFCGESHAYMRFKIIAVEPDQFTAFVDGWRQGASAQAANIAPEGDVDRVPQALGLCIACHRIGGVPNNPGGQPLTDLPMGIEGGITAENQIYGPNLSMFACRTTIAAGILPNTEESLRTWLHNPPGVKQGNFMGTAVTEGSLTDEQITEIVAYLKTLQPEGGCPVITGIHAESVERLADEPAAETTAGTQPDNEAFVNENRFKS
jgi:cytochrome c oxidase subunit 2